MARWHICSEKQPDNERQVLVARPDRDYVEAAQYLRPEMCWVEAGTNEEIWPSCWRDMPRSLFAE